MRVLMLGRPDVYQVVGGDTIQMEQTKKGLEKLGLSVCASPVSAAPDFSGFDIIHLFNWEQLRPFLKQHQAELAGGVPLVLSTIFWYHTGHWFDHAVVSIRFWKLVSAVIGLERARRVYESWQEIKFRRGEQGKELRRDLFIPAQLLPNSHLEIQHLESVLGLKGSLEARATVVINGISRELFDPLPAADADLLQKFGRREIVLQVGRIQAAKNQLGLIQALAGTDFPIVFIGQPSPYEADYVEQCYQSGRQRGNVHFLGPMQAEKLAGIYALAAVHVLPSWRETPGLVSLEAAAAGCKAVSTSIGSAREYFGDLAWYCNPRQPASIRGAVLQALASPKTDALRQRVLERFTWEAAAQNTLGAYQKVR